MTPEADRIDRVGSRAVLIGVSEYHDPSFPPVPAAKNSLRDMQQMLVDQELGGWAYDQVISIPDPVDCRRVLGDLRRLAEDTHGVLLLYFVGHGTVTEKGDLVLAVTDTDAHDPDVSGLEYSKIRNALLRSPAKVKAVILDCCYSSREIEALADDEQYLANSTDVRGTYTLTAADLNAHAGQPDTCTAFTGELLDLIGTGVADGPPVLTFAELYPHLRQRLIARNLPRPNQRGTDTADKCPVVWNASGRASTTVHGRDSKNASAARQEATSAPALPTALRELSPAAPTPPNTPPRPASPPTGRDTVTPKPISRTATAAITLALLCLPGLAVIIFLAVEYLPYSKAPTRLIEVNLAVAIVEAVVLATGARLLFQHKMAGRWMIVTTGGMAALHCGSVSVQYLLAGGPSEVMIPLAVTPLAAVSAAAAVITAALPSTRRWCLPDDSRALTHRSATTPH